MTIFIDFGALLGGLGSPKSLKNRWFLIVFQGFAFFVLEALGRGFWRVLGSILEALGPILGGSWAILGHFGGQDGPKMVPRGG